MVGWLYVIKRWTIWMTSSCIFLKNYFEQSLIIHRHFFLSMVETCVYNSYILWLTKLKCFREISAKTKTKGRFTCVCQTDHLFTKQRASELMIWLRYAIEVKYFSTVHRRCTTHCLPWITNTWKFLFFSKLMSMFRE